MAMLNTGQRMPMLGLGVFAGGEGEKSVVQRYLTRPLSHGGAMQPLPEPAAWESEAEAAVVAAIDCGYRSIDTAFIYGTEPAVGRAIAAKIADGTVRRSELFVTTKLTQAHHSPCLVEAALRRSLANLGLDYVDLYLVHGPIAYTHDEPLGLWPERADGSRIYDEGTSLLDTWRGMEGVHAVGLAKAIGISNYSAKQVEELVSAAAVIPAINQVECHPFCTQEPLLQVCRRHGIVLSAYSPLGGNAKGSAMKEQLMGQPLLVRIAQAHGLTVAQVLLRFQVQRGIVTIAKSFTPARIAANFEVVAAEFSEPLSTTEMAQLCALDMCWRGVPPGMVPASLTTNGAPSGLEDDGNVYAKYADHPLYAWPELLGVPLNMPPPAHVRAASELMGPPKL
eukprot:COSAG05_NODE_108_length_18693_cov_7.956709_15_plen_394_part_00